MHHELEVLTTSEAVAARAADIVVQCSRAAIADHERFVFAVSGGRSPWQMFAELTTRDLRWDRTVIFQVDERVAPEGDPARNLTPLRASLGKAPAEVVSMPVTDPDLDAAADRYARLLPYRFDLVHLGLGPDGHTASLVPDDPALKVTDHPVAVTGDYQGHPRMTLTYPALARADQLLWLVTGAGKQPALAKVLAGDESIPAGRVVARESLIIADRGAAGP